MPPHDVTTADRQLAINQLASALLPLVKNDVSKANSYAVQVESKIFDISTSKEVWWAKFQAKLKGVQNKVLAQQQSQQAKVSVASSHAMPPPAQPMAAPQRPGMMLQQPVAQAPPAMQAGAMQQQAMYQQPQVAPPSAFAAQQAVAAAQQAQQQQQQQYLAAQQAAAQQAKRPELVKMPTFTDPAFQQMARAFLESSDENTAALPGAQHAPAAALAAQQAQQAAALQQQRLAQQQQQQQAAAVAQAQAQAQAQAMQQQRLQQQQQQAALAAQHAQQAAMQQAQQAAAQQYGQPMLMQQQQQMAAAGGMMYRGAVLPPQQQQQQGMAQGMAQGMLQQPMQQQQLPQQPMQQQPMQQQQLQMQQAAAAGVPQQQQQQLVGVGGGAAAAGVQPELPATQPYLAEYVKLQQYARQHLMEDTREMLRFLSNTPDTTGNMRRRVQGLNLMLALVEDREPHLHTVVDAAAVHKLRDKLTQLQKDVQKFRTYLANHKDKLAREAQVSAAQTGGLATGSFGGSLPSSAHGPLASAGGPSVGLVPQGYAAAQQAQQAQLAAAGMHGVGAFPGGMPGMVAASPGAGMSPATAAQMAFTGELMDESQPNLPPPGPPAPSPALARAGSSSAASARPVPQLGRATSGPGVLQPIGSMGASIGASSDTLRAAAQNAVAQQAAAQQGAVAAAARPPGRPAVPPARQGPAQQPPHQQQQQHPPLVATGSRAIDNLPRDPPTRLLMWIKKRTESGLEVAAAGVQRVLQHADAAIPTPPLPPEALRRDGWPREAVESLLQGPQGVLSRPSGSARIAGVAAGAPGEGGEGPAAKRQRVEGSGTAEGGGGEGAVAAAAAARERLRSQVAAECQHIEAKLTGLSSAGAGAGGVKLAAGPAGLAGQPGDPGALVVVTCEWHGGPEAAASATADALPPWRRLQLRVGPTYPAEPPVPIFPGQGPVAGAACVLAEAVKDALHAALLGMPPPLTLEAVVAQWAAIVGSVAQLKNAARE